MSVLINRNYTRLWVGQIVSLVGDMVFDTTLMIWVAAVLLKGKSYAPLVSSSVMIVASLSVVLVAPVAGVFVDRWDKRRTMMAADLIRAGLIAILTAVAWLPHGTVPVPVILVLLGLTVALTSGVAQFFNPSRMVLIGDIVPAEQRGRASSYSMAAMSIASIIGPPLAAPLLIGVGPQWALALNATSFLASFIAIRTIRSPRIQAPADRSGAKERGAFRREFGAGLALFRTNRLLSALLVTIIIVMIGGGAVNALHVYFVGENLHSAPTWLGVLEACYGGGLLVGALIGGRLGDRIGHAKVYAGSVVVFGLAFTLFGRVSDLSVAFGAEVVLGVVLGAVNVVMGPLLMKIVDRDFLGRVMSVFNPASQSAAILSMVLAGAVATALGSGFSVEIAGQTFHRLDAIFTVGGLLVLAAGVYASVTLRGADTARAVESVPVPEPAVESA